MYISPYLLGLSQSAWPLFAAGGWAANKPPPLKGAGFNLHDTIRHSGGLSMEEAESLVPEELLGKVARTALLIHVAMDEITEIRDQMGLYDPDLPETDDDPLDKADLELTIALGYLGEVMTGTPAADSYAVLYANLALGFAELANSVADPEGLEREGEAGS